MLIIEFLSVITSESPIISSNRYNFYVFVSIFVFLSCVFVELCFLDEIRFCYVNVIIELNLMWLSLDRVFREINFVSFFRKIWVEMIVCKFNKLIEFVLRLGESDVGFVSELSGWACRFFLLMYVINLIVCICLCVDNCSGIV